MKAALLKGIISLVKREETSQECIRESESHERL